MIVFSHERRKVGVFSRDSATAPPPCVNAEIREEKHLALAAFSNTNTFQPRALTLIFLSDPGTQDVDIIYGPFHPDFISEVGSVWGGERERLREEKRPVLFLISGAAARLHSRSNPSHRFCT